MKFSINANIIARLCCLGFALFIMAIAGCANITTRPLHDPIYPSSGETVTFNLKAESSSGISNVSIYETISEVDATGVVTAGTPSLLESRDFPAEPSSIDEDFSKAGGYDANRLVQYEFKVTNGDDKTRSHSVTFAIRPYPVTDQPAPVYAQGDVDDVFDIVLIPDTDVTNMTIWRDNCRELIVNTIHREETLRIFSRSYNFYINPRTGTATDYDRRHIDGSHQLPSNNANLTFAELRCLMHQNILRDYESGGIISMEMDRPQTFLHEGGHGLYALADEYPDGTHYEADEFPNNWEVRADAEADAPSRRKSAADVVKMGSSDWYKMCASSCPMRSGSALLFDFDEPCEDRIIYETLWNAID
jgi:hypothetical protein